MKLIFTSLLVVATLQPMVLAQVQTPISYLITGEVRDPQGKIACGVVVCAVPIVFNPTKQPEAQPCAASDRDGRFAIKLSRAGGYNLFYSGPDRQYLPQVNPFFRNPAIPIPQVSLSDSNIHATATVFMSPKNGRLTGKIFDAQTGLPVEGADFSMCHADNPRVCWHKGALADTGEFDVPAPHVPFTLRIKKARFYDWIGLSGAEGNTPITVPGGTKLELTPYLKRLPDAMSSAISESEKRTGVNLPAPVQLHPLENEVFDIYPRLTRLEWEAVEGAVSYSVEVDYCFGPGKGTKACIDAQPLNINNPSMSGIAGTVYDFHFVGAQWGRWRVWALDREGREGFKSSWRHFVYYR